jgi:hypothetical protein
MDQAIQPSRAAFRRLEKRRLPPRVNVGAQSHGLHTRCLRFAAPVARTLRKTRYRLAANLYQAGLAPAELLTSFQDSIPRRPSQTTRLPWRTQDLTPVIN